VPQVKKVLFVAFHFPPYSGGSGVHRAFRFACYLPENGWRPYVLTAHERAYEKVDPAGLAVLGGDACVIRAFALDAQRHMAFRGRYLRWSALPDRWVNWAAAAVAVGLVKLYKEKIDLILVTFPIATAVLIGVILHRLTRKPLVVDFRDSMTEDEYPREAKTRAVYKWIERSAVESGSRFIFTTPSARRMYLNRYPGLAGDKCIVIPNGYDDHDFAGAAPGHPSRQRRAEGRVRLVHAGVIYPEDRDPRAFFGALRRLKEDGVIDAASLAVDLRASGFESYYSELLKALGIDDLVHLLPALPHRDALEDMRAADGLLLLQAASCNHQIPAKVYEYLRLGKPILALTPGKSDTAALLTEVGGATIAELSDEDSILEAMPAFIESVRRGAHPLPNLQEVQRYSRRRQAADLAHCLDQLLECSIEHRRTLYEEL